MPSLPSGCLHACLTFLSSSLHNTTKLQRTFPVSLAVKLGKIFDFFQGQNLANPSYSYIWASQLEPQWNKKHDHCIFVYGCMAEQNIKKSSTAGRYPSKVVFHQRSSSIKCCLPWRSLPICCIKCALESSRMLTCYSRNLSTS